MQNVTIFPVKDTLESSGHYLLSYNKLAYTTLLLIKQDQFLYSSFVWVDTILSHSGDWL